MDPCFGRLPGASLKYSEGLDLKYATPMSKETASLRSRGWRDKQPTVLQQTMAGAVVQSNALKLAHILLCMCTEITLFIIAQAALEPG